jgi:hypothetical protein
MKVKSEACIIKPCCSSSFLLALDLLERIAHEVERDQDLRNQE